MSFLFFLLNKTMGNFARYRKRFQNLCSCSCLKLACTCRSMISVPVFFCRYVLTIMDSFSINLVYLLVISTLGFLILRGLSPKTDLYKPGDIDLFFTSVSAVTVTSLSTIEMEVFSNKQLLFWSILIFAGGEVFTSMAGLHFGRFKLRRLLKKQIRVGSASSESSPSKFLDQIELEIVENPDSENSVPQSEFTSQINSVDRKYLRYKSIRLLSFVLLGYLLVIHLVGVSLVLVYFSHVSTATNVLKAKGLELFTFSVFISVSTFANCGFVPTNENMIVFQKNSGLLWILIPLILLGNTLFPPFLRLSVWFIGKFVQKNETSFLLRNSEEIGILYFLPRLSSLWLVVTAVGFILVQFVLFCSMEWNSTALSGMTSYEKFVGILFQTVNTRYSGENIVDLATIAQAILVLFTMMMYFPPYTSFLPVKVDEQFPYDCEKKRKTRGKVVENIIFSQLSYIVIFVILICITERKRMKEDPINFSVLNIVVEVVSAYGNVGYSTGYGCARQLNPDNNCQDKWYGFSGRWSDQGKLILIFVMFFGRLKKFNMAGGRAWKLT